MPKTWKVIFAATCFGLLAAHPAFADDDDTTTDDQTQTTDPNTSTDDDASSSTDTSSDSAAAAADFQTVMAQCNDANMSSAQVSACLGMLKRIMSTYPVPGAGALMDKIQSQADQIAAPDPDQ